MGMGYALALVLTLLVGFPFVWTAWWLLDAIVEAMGGHASHQLRQAGSLGRPIS
jgi:Na+-driven multidrug efflux pump